MTPVEAVARAIAKRRNLDGLVYLGDDGQSKECWTQFTEDAKAAIRALAENVTDEMAWQTMTEKDDVRAAILAALEEE